MEIITKLGVLNITANSTYADRTDVYSGDIKVATLPCYWWDKDSLDKALEKQSELIKKRIAERGAEVTHVTQDNMAALLEECIDLLNKNEKDADKRNAMTSRLAEVVNELKCA